MISIKVVRASTGNPVQGARVGVWQGGLYETMTDDKGLAHFEKVSPGSHTVYIDSVKQDEQHLSGITVIYI